MSTTNFSSFRLYEVLTLILGTEKYGLSILKGKKIRGYDNVSDVVAFEPGQIKPALEMNTILDTIYLVGQGVHRAVHAHCH